MPLSTTSKPIIASGAASCPEEWSLYDNSCYKLFGLELNYAQAESYCSQQIQGSFLVEINSDLELSFLQSTFITHISVNTWVSINIYLYLVFSIK